MLRTSGAQFVWGEGWPYHPGELHPTWLSATSKGLLMEYYMT
jgi:hypothetical protein